MKSGKTYSAVLIGTQTWMASDLTIGTSSSSNWAAAMDLLPKCNSESCSGDILTPHLGICPDGWHIPSAAEWTTLIDFVKDPMALMAYESSYSSNTGWPGSNTYGFSAMHSGKSFGNSYTDYYGSWWSATETSASSAGTLYLFWSNNTNLSGPPRMSVGSISKTQSIGVRCLKN